jgi:hypothetical protein
MSTEEMRIHLPWNECQVAVDDGCLVALESPQRLLMEWRTAASHVVVNPLDPQSSSMESPFTAASVVTNGTLERPHQLPPILLSAGYPFCPNTYRRRFVSKILP